MPCTTTIIRIPFAEESLLISLGVNIELIAERLGDTIVIIRKTYAHLFPTYNDDIIELTTNENIDKINNKMTKYLKKTR